MFCLQCHQCEGEKSGDMFYYKGSLYPLLGDHPDIKKAWEAWDEIITLWDKTAKGEGSLSSIECLDTMFEDKRVLPSNNRTLQLKNTISAVTVPFNKVCFILKTP